MKPDISVVIPVYNEEANLPALFERVMKTMDALGRPFEVIFTNDGSKDRSGEILREFFKQRPKEVRVVDFNGNYGQHMAIMAALERARGKMAVTLDADLQNPPEEIPKLVAAIDAGHDSVGGCRIERQDTSFRKYASKFLNALRERTTDIKMTDQGCMLRAYDERVVKAIVQCGERSTFLPALAYKFSHNPGEVQVEHAARAHGESKYNLYKLLRLNFDLITGFTLLPLQAFTIFSVLCAAGSFLLVLLLFYLRFFEGDDTNGVFTLFAILFFLISVCMIGIGLIGEYVGRTYQAVQQRPRYSLKEVLETKDTE